VPAPDALTHTAHELDPAAGPQQQPPGVVVGAHGVPGEQPGQDGGGELGIVGERNPRPRAASSPCTSSSAHAIAAKPEGSGEPKGWNPRVPAGAASTPAASARDAASKLVSKLELEASTRTFTSKAAFSRPLHMSTEYHSGLSAACATTEATVNSSPGTGAFQSAPRTGSRVLSHNSAAARSSSPVTVATTTRGFRRGTAEDHCRDSREIRHWCRGARIGRLADDVPMPRHRTPVSPSAGEPRRELFAGPVRPPVPRIGTTGHLAQQAGSSGGVSVADGTETPLQRAR